METNGKRNLNQAINPNLEWALYPFTLAAFAKTYPMKELTVPASLRPFEKELKEKARRILKELDDPKILLALGEGKAVEKDGLLLYPTAEGGLGRINPQDFRELARALKEAVGEAKEEAEKRFRRLFEEKYASSLKELLSKPLPENGALVFTDSGQVELRQIDEKYLPDAKDLIALYLTPEALQKIKEGGIEAVYSLFKEKALTYFPTALELEKEAEERFGFDREREKVYLDDKFAVYFADNNWTFDPYGSPEEFDEDYGYFLIEGASFAEEFEEKFPGKRTAMVEDGSELVPWAVYEFGEAVVEKEEKKRRTWYPDFF
jgi:hypothetical protein